MDWDETEFWLKDGANLAIKWNVKWYSAVFILPFLNTMWNQPWFHGCSRAKKETRVKIPVPLQILHPHLRPHISTDSICLLFLAFVLETCWFCIHVETWEWCCGFTSRMLLQLGIYWVADERECSGRGCSWGMSPLIPSWRNWERIITKVKEDLLRVEALKEDKKNRMMTANCRW